MKTDMFGRTLPVVRLRNGRAPDDDLIRRDPPWSKAYAPYAYCPFTIWGEPYPNKDCNGSDYTDRLAQWNHTKYRRLSEIYYKGASPFNSRNCLGDKIELFLQAWYDDARLELIRVIEYCNASNGFPLWRLDYISTKAKEG